MWNFLGKNTGVGYHFLLSGICIGRWIIYHCTTWCSLLYGQTLTSVHDYWKNHAKSLQLCLTLCNPMDCQAPLSMGFSRQEYWSGLPCPPPGDLPDPGIKPLSLSLLHWLASSLSLAPPCSTTGEPSHHNYYMLLREFSSVQFSHSVVSDSLPSHGLQHTRLPCPSPTPGACSDSCPLSQ